MYLKCSGNKRASTVSSIFLEAVEKYGWPSRMRGDFGTENNEVENLMKEHWGEAHRAYLRGRYVLKLRQIIVRFISEFNAYKIIFLSDQHIMYASSGYGVMFEKTVWSLIARYSSTSKRATY